jgi:soluble lytic murein transglycosylase-like protein
VRYVSFITLAIFAAPAARGEVYEIGKGGALVNITQSEWRPATPSAATTTLRERTAAVVAGPVPHQEKIEAAAADYGLAPELVKAVAWQESRYNAHARSATGALGVMQLMPGTARQLGVTNPLDPEQNIRGGTAYLKQQLTRFRDDLPLALAAYNAGPGAVIRYGGIPPYLETRAYVRSIMARLAAEADAAGRTEESRK